MQEKGAYYVSRLKSNTQVYFKNPSPSYFKNGTIIKKTEYIPVSLEELMAQLHPGETHEVEGAYIGRKEKFPVRVLIHRLSRSQEKQRLDKLKESERIRGIKYSERSKRLTGLNAYITNLPIESVSKEEIHPLYSLRWQIELLFKTWKSFLHVDFCKPMKLERLECHIYAQFISLLICTSTVYKMRKLLLQKKEKELSEYKAFYIVLSYYSNLSQAIEKDTEDMTKLLFRLFLLLQKNGRKSHRHEKKTVFDILGVNYHCNR